MGPYRQDACRRPYQDPTSSEARSLDKAIEFGGYSTSDQLIPIAISAISAIFRLPVLCRDTRSPLKRLQDTVNTTLYIACRLILLTDYCSHFSYLLPHYILSPLPPSCIYRGSRATFTIKSFIQFFPTAKLIVILGL